MRRSLALTAMLILTRSLAAQTGAARQIELGVFGSWTRFDPTAVFLEPEFGAGGRLAFHLNRTFAIEAAGDYTETSTRDAAASQVRATRVGGSLLGHLPAGFNTFYLGLGAEQNFYRGAYQSELTGLHAALGDRISLGGRAALRLEGRAAVLPSADIVTGEDRGLNLSVNAGLSIFAFGGPPRDSDGDGVPDARDVCGGTPANALVDSNGCPLDSDRDRVFDGIDSCPGTPIGASIDAAGCPSDGDADGVFDGIDVCPATPAGARVDAGGCPFDSDGDTVLDGIDQCADTPAGASVDAAGCPTDADGDTVFDGIDRCAGTAAGVPVDASGCPLDADGDGVHDGADRCAGTPAGTRVDASGCPVSTDSDGDGVGDSLDRCPGTAPGRQVDQAGCPVLFQVDQQGRAQAVVLRGVTFRSGSSQLTPESGAALDEVAGSLLVNTEVRIEIAGHTDATGSRDRNTELSIRRAEAVRQYLISRGVSGDRLVARGYGPDRPVATNSTVAGRAQNRRVELSLIEND